MDSSGPKDAQVQSYSSGGANALMKGHVAVTCRITLNHLCTAAMRLMANFFYHLLSLDTPTYTVAQIAKRFEPSTVLWTFHAVQPSSCSLYCFVSFCTRQIFSACMFLCPDPCDASTVKQPQVSQSNEV